MNILSLFDGLACGMLAMLKAGIQVDNYYAYEIDKYAIKTSQHNFPKIKQCGDVFKGDYTQYEGIDYLIGGSPRTYWSIAQSPDKPETTASGIGLELFSQYVRALHEAKPKFFIYENNKSMSKAIRESITQTFGFEPICINSALVSAQNRQRLYWVGKRNADGTYSKVDVEQPEDRGILLRDVLDGVTDRDKGRCVIGSTGRTTEREYFKKNQGNMSFEPVGTTKGGKAYCLSAGYSNGSGEKIGNYAAHTLQKGCKSMVAEPVNVTAAGKAQCLRATCYKDGVRNIAGNDIDKKTGVAEPVCLQEQVFGRRKQNDGTYDRRYEAKTDGKSPALTSIESRRMLAEPVRVGLFPTSDGRLLDSQGMRVYSVDAKSVTQSAQGGGMGAKTGLYAIPVLKVREATRKGHIEVNCGELFDYEQPNSKTQRGRKMCEKSNCLTTSCNFYQYIAYAVEFNENGEPTKAVSKADGKTYTVYEVKGGNITIKGKTYPIKLIDGYYIIRKLTVSECKRLQTVPEWYEFPVSNTRAYKMLGNGWTVDVIAHLLKMCKK